MARKKNRKPAKLPVRMPTAKPTIWHDDRSKYNRRRNKDNLKKEVNNYERAD